MDERDPRGESAGSMGRLATVKDLPSRTEFTAIIKVAMKLNDDGGVVARPKAAPKAQALVPAVLSAARAKNRTAKSPEVRRAGEQLMRPYAGQLICLLMAGACASSHAGSGTPVAPREPASLRVYSSAANTTISFSDLIATAAKADMVFLGEQHDDPETHFAELALLEGIGRLRPNVVLSLEMFERDVQPALDAYLAGRMSEADFLAASRPWPQYATDYRPLVQLARARGWPVIAANVPRPIASAVSRKGLSVLDTLSAASRAYAARELSCPHDRYYDLFAESTKGHSAGGVSTTVDTAAAGMTNRFYEAQCVKDETMGESVAQALVRAGTGAIVVHVDGAFHSDYGLGTAARARRRLPVASRVIITGVPVADPANATADSLAARADYLVFTRASAPKTKD
ncbi:MAG: hypothetical protein JWM95_1093 [Gemmatimonadetes bacterium]|nr:hypothetical protein [Gemmatimonadota bacterium]